MDKKLFEIIGDDKISSAVKLKKIKYMANLGVDLNTIYHGKNAMALAIELKEDEIASFFEQNGVNSIVLSDKERNILGEELFQAIINKRNDEALELIEKGANLGYEFIEEGGGKTNVMNMAIQHGNKNIVRVLLDEGFDVNIGDNYNTPLVCACTSLLSEDDAIEIIEMLLSNGADINKKDQSGNPPIFWAAIGEKKRVVEALIANRCDLNVEAENGLTALNAACWKGYKDIAEILINKGANLEKADKVGDTPLITACEFERLEIAELLIKSGASVNAQSKKNGFTPLMHAVHLGNKELTKLLIENGADVNMKNNHKASAMSIANSEMRKVILDAIKVKNEKEEGSKGIMSKLKAVIFDGY